MVIAALRRHPALQFWPTHWAWEDGALATILFARNEGVFALTTSTFRGDRISADLYRWLRGGELALTSLSAEGNVEMRERVLDGSVWLEMWSLWPWGWTRDTSARPCCESPSSSALDAAAARLVKDLPQGLPVLPGRWLPNAVVKREAVPCGGA